MSEHVKVPRGAPRVQFLGDGSQTVFTYPFPIFASEDLEVSLGAALQGDGYTVAGAGVSAGGSVTFANPPAAGVAVTLRRRVPVERVTDFLESGPLSALALNTELDLLTACLQQVAEDQNRMLRYPDTDLPASVELPGRGVRAHQLLAFDGAGNPTVAPQLDGEALSTYLPRGTGAVARPIRDKLGDLASVRDFGAVGDGLTDDTVAIQSALTARDVVYVPAGTYQLSGSLTLGYGKTLFGDGQASILRGADTSFDLIRIPEGYATLRDLRLERGRAGVRLLGADGPCVQNRVCDLTLWGPRWGIVLDGYTRADRPCYWNTVARVLVAEPLEHGVWLTRSGAGDTPNANKFWAVRVQSLAAETSGCGFFVEAGRYNNSFLDCEANLWSGAACCFRVGAATDKNLIVNLYCESLGAVPNLQLDAGSVETAIVNLFSASAGPAILDYSGGRYTAFNAGYPTKNRLAPAEITDLTVQTLRFDTEFYDPAEAGLYEIGTGSSVHLVSAYNGAVEARLPAAGLVNGFAVTLKKTDATANPVTVTEASGPGPDGRTVVLANRYDFVSVISNGAGWWITGANRLPGNSRYVEGLSLFEPDLDQELYLVSAWGGEVNVRLPMPWAAHAVGRTVTVKKADVSPHLVWVTAVDVTGPDAEAIPLSGRGHAVTVMSDGAGWQILGRNP